MFDFRNLDDIDDEGAAPEWLKWRGTPEWQRAAETSPAVLEDTWEELGAAPEVAEEEFTYERLEVPFLPEDKAFDPMGLAGETTDAIEERNASWNGQVIVNFIAGAVEEFMMRQYEKEQRKAYIESLHQDRLSQLSHLAHSKLNVPAMGDTQKNFDRKKFNWRELQSPHLGHVIGLPEGGAFSESAFTPSARVMKSITKIKGALVMPTSALVQMLCSMGNQVRPMPTGRIGRSAEWHLALTDVFFPSGFIIDEGKDYIEKKQEAPTLVHLVAMSVNKETGPVEAKRLLQNVKLANPNEFRFMKKRQALSD